jgi:hypothetical protein
MGFLGDAFNAIKSGVRKFASGFKNNFSPTTFLGKAGQGVSTALKASSGVGSLLEAGKQIFYGSQGKQSQATQNIKPNLVSQIFNQASQYGLSQFSQKYQGAKVPGIATPGSTIEPLTGAQQGQQTRDYLENAFPGLTPWEHAGANSAQGAMQSSSTQARTQKEMQERELKTKLLMQEAELNNRVNVADKQARASVIGSASQYGANGIVEATKALDGATPEQFNTMVTLANKKVEYEISKLKTETEKQVRELWKSEQQALLTGNLEAWHALKQKLSNLKIEPAVKNTIISAGKKLVEYAGQAGNTAKLGLDKARKIYTDYRKTSVSKNKREFDSIPRILNYAR